MTRHHHDWNSSRLVIAEQPLANFVAVDVRQAVIEQHEVRSRELRATNTFRASVCGGDLERRIGRRKYFLHELEQQLGIVNNNDFFAGRCLGFAPLAPRRGNLRLRHFLRRKVTEHVDEQRRPRDVNCSGRSMRSIGLGEMEIAPARHLFDRRKIHQPRRDRVGDLTFGEMDFTPAPAARFHMQDGIHADDALQRDHVDERDVGNGLATRAGWLDEFLDQFAKLGQLEWLFDEVNAGVRAAGFAEFARGAAAEREQTRRRVRCAQMLDELHNSALRRIKIDNDELRPIRVGRFFRIPDRADNMSRVLRRELAQCRTDRDDERVVIFDQEQIARRAFPYVGIAGLRHGGTGCERRSGEGRCIRAAIVAFSPLFWLLEFTRYS